MRKDPNVLEKRNNYVKRVMNQRHKSETVVMCAQRLARELFLSESTIWKDYVK
jgi:hypothetical protein